ncbi:MAG: hotdog fold thioesterase [Bacteroidetes bacterium]|nr:hotdog fold thioesterase [Bacteroidota bacterium]MCH8524115.1 hotdog fold thioesterase [Balneolales bacterium]
MHIDDNVKEAVEALFNGAVPNISDVLGIEFARLTKDEVVARMPVDSRTHQPFGILHGGASVVLAETVCSVAGYLNVDYHTQMAVGLEINANHVRPVRSGYVIGTATPIHRGATTQLWDIRITTETNKLVCVSRCTLAVVKKK